MGLLKRWFGPPTPAAFAERMRRAIGRSGDARTYSFDAGRFCLSTDQGVSHTLYLHNAYRDYCAAGRRERPNVLRNYASIANLSRDENQAENLTFEQLRPQLLPRVREATYWTAFDLNIRCQRAASPTTNDRPPLDGFVLRPFADGLTLEVVIDHPTAIQSLARGTVDKWGVPFADVIKAARDNLWAISNANFVTVRPGLFMSPYRDTHDAARLALHDLIWQLPVRGRHVAMIPNRNVLLVAGDDDAENLEALAEMSRRVLTEPRPMTGTAYRLEETTWHPYLPPSDSPAHWPLRSVAIESTSRDYGEQAELLDRLHGAMGADVFVARQTLMRRDDGSLYTWAVWVESVTHGMLPRVDRVAMGTSRDGKNVTLGFARWEVLQQVCGHRMEPVADLFPPRWRVRSFPSADELSALKLTETPA